MGWNNLSILKNVNGCTVEVWEWISNLVTHFSGHMIITLAGINFNPCLLKGPKVYIQASYCMDLFVSVHLYKADIDFFFFCLRMAHTSQAILIWDRSGINRSCNTIRYPSKVTRPGYFIFDRSRLDRILNFHPKTYRIINKVKFVRWQCLVALLRQSNLLIRC